MLSKKMTVSLMSLITIFALAFAVPSAMAGEFGVSLDMTGDISTAGGLQLEHPGTELMVTVQFAQAVVLANTNISIDGYDMDGDYIAGVALAKKAPITPTTAARMIMLKIAVTAETAKVTLKIAKGIASASFANEDTSAELKVDIHLVDKDVGTPTVYSVERADASLLPVKSSTVDVVITLSEPPKEFKKAHVDVSNATWGDPVAVTPIAEETVPSFVTPLLQLTPARTLYDDVDTDGDGTDDEGIHAHLVSDGEAFDDGDEDTAAKYGDLHTASADLAIAEAAATAVDAAAQIKGGIAVADLPTSDATAAQKKQIPYAAPEKMVDITASIDGTEVTIEIDASVRPTLPVNPVAGDLALYTAKKMAYDLYMAGETYKKEYDKAVAAEMVIDKNLRAKQYADQSDMTLQVATGRTSMLYRYVLTITPKYENKNDIVVKVKEWEDQKSPTANKYRPADMIGRAGYDGSGYKEGVNKLTIKVGKEVLKDKTAGIEVKLLNEGIIPKDGYLVVAKDRASSAVRDPSGTADGDDPKEAPSTTNRQPFGRTYNIVPGDLPNLETLLINGGTIDLVAPAAGLVISEIMWGSDASIADSFKSQYIEIRNTSGADIKMGDGTHKLVFYAAGSSLPDMSVAANNIQDRVGTIGAGGYWSIAGKGQSGRTGVGEAPGDVVAITPTVALISMQRVIDATGVAADGTLAGSWAQSSPPGLNFDLTKEGTRIGSPGRAPTTYPVAPTPEPAAVVVPVAMPDDIMITEIMVDTGDGRLPQWIELTNVSGAEVSLAGWSLMITNAEADADAIGETVSINLSGTLGVGGGEDAGGTMGKSLLLVGGAARSSSNLSGSTRVVDISSQVDQTGRYTFISTMAFMAALVPPQMTGVVAYGDTAGNLDADEAWEIPMDESGRSSLIRREMDAKGMMTMGTAANGWVLASSTSLVSGPATWYGSDEDAGTPGYDAGGPLPVELSHFRPARDKQTGAVVITWSTQSELNNAGFFIKRSQQRDGQFKVINATMVAGAGTSSEKQSYTYTDSTAQPNVVYYYQIEDVSLDGQRQTLTHGTRLKGHIGAAGKLTSTWGEIKSSNE